MFVGHSVRWTRGGGYPHGKELTPSLTPAPGCMGTKRGAGEGGRTPPLMVGSKSAENISGLTSRVPKAQQKNFALILPFWGCASISCNFWGLASILCHFWGCLNFVLWQSTPPPPLVQENPLHNKRGARETSLSLSQMYSTMFNIELLPRVCWLDLSTVVCQVVLKKAVNQTVHRTLRLCGQRVRVESRYWQIFLPTENCISCTMFPRQTACHKGWSPLPCQACSKPC